MRREGLALALDSAVVALQAVLAWITRSFGSFFKAAFGWSVLALFGPRPRRGQTVLSVAVAAAVAWPFLVLGIIFPLSIARIAPSARVGIGPASTRLANCVNDVD